MMFDGHLKQSRGRHPERPAHILLVEDDEQLRGVTKLVLNIHGYQVDTATDGQDAVEKLASEKFDVVITDIQMPRMDGCALIRAMRASGNPLPIVVASSLHAPNLLPRDVRTEVAGIVTKPMTVIELLAAVREAIASAKPCVQ